MKKFFVSGICLLFVFFAGAQMIFPLSDPVTSRNFSMDRYSSTKGTPFLVDKWMKGSVKVARGVYQNLDLKFNVYDNFLVFNKDDEAYELQDDIISFTLMPNPDDTTANMVFKKGVVGPGLKENQYVQVLFEGPQASAYRLDQKQLSDVNEINAGVVKSFANNSKYYVRVGQQMQFVTLTKANILEVLKDKEGKLEAFIADKKLKFKKDADLGVLVKYYNTL